ncbi:hypothetical protein AOT82_845 [Psychrobacter sp. AntiMn-1]|nr:hypothetical protein AOT82_845 [Psychrobacter sp. AntiMn-1]
MIVSVVGFAMVKSLLILVMYIGFFDGLDRVLFIVFLL